MSFLFLCRPWMNKILCICFGVAVFIAFLFLGIGNFYHEEDVVIRLGEGSTLYPFLSVGVLEYMKNYPNVVISTSQDSSGTSIKKLIRGDVDISGASRLPNDNDIKEAEDGGFGFDVFHVATDAVAIVVHRSKFDYVEALSKGQLRGIFFEGTINNWSEINSNLSGEINVFVRDPEVSGAATLFNKILLDEGNFEYVNDSILFNSNLEVVSSLASDPNGIAYIPLFFVNNKIKAISYINDNVSVYPTIENIMDFSYPLTRKMYLIVRNSSGERVGNFVDFMLSPQEQRMIKERGFVPAINIE